MIANPDGHHDWIWNYHGNKALSVGVLRLGQVMSDFVWAAWTRVIDRGKKEKASGAFTSLYFLTVDVISHVEILHHACPTVINCFPANCKQKAASYPGFVTSSLTQ